MPESLAMRWWRTLTTSPAKRADGARIVVDHAFGGHFKLRQNKGECGSLPKPPCSSDFGEPGWIQNVLLSQAEALLANFEQDGETSYIDEAIDLDRKALQLCLPGDNKRSVALALLAPHVHAPDEQLGITKDLDEAIRTPNRSQSLNNLAIRLSTRYNQLGAMQDLDEAIVLHPFLRKVWHQIILPIVDSLQTTLPSRSRIWWCPTAKFSLLPLHATRPFPFRKGQRTLADLYVPSYTPPPPSFALYNATLPVLLQP
ncbi:hypothetical protein V8E55_006838 [Tylopilus felleus]